MNWGKRFLAPLREKKHGSGKENAPPNKAKVGWSGKEGKKESKVDETISLQILKVKFLRISLANEVSWLNSIIVTVIQLKNYSFIVDYVRCRKQNEITPSRRRQLLDWMIEITDALNADQEVFHLSVFYIDRYLSEVSLSPLPISKFQLLGVTSFFVASYPYKCVLA